MEGTIANVENHGSIVILWLDLEDGGSQPVYLDHRAFGWLVVGEGLQTVADLIGRSVYFDGESINFLDNVEAA